MTTLVLDAGAFLAVERNDRSMVARLRTALDRGIGLRTHSMIVAQIWRDPSGRQVHVARLLKAVEVETLNESIGRASGILLGATKTSDAIDSALVVLARTGDRILTSDPDDIQRLASVAVKSVTVVAC